MPSSSTSLDLFETLTIDPQMSPTVAEIRSRAVEVRDILSSFNRDILPSEFRPQIFAELDRPSRTRPPVSQWTIQEDLSATLLQWGAYNDQAYELLSRLQSDSTLTRCFYEKLRRRFEALREEYDRLTEDYEIDRSEIQRIAEEFVKVVAAVKEDRPYREQGQEAVVKRLLDAMIDICTRHTDIVPTSQPPTTPRRGSRRVVSSPTEGPSNLYEALIQNPVHGLVSDAFMLDVLETFPASVYINLESEHSRIASLLDINNAPVAYKYRFGRLPSASSSMRVVVSGSQSRSQSRSGRRGPSSPGRATTTHSNVPEMEGATQPRAQTQARATSTTGSKRSAEDTGAKGKRGRKKTTH